MATSELAATKITWTTDGSTVAVSAIAAADTLTLTGDLASDVRLEGVATPVATTDAANKAYVDAAAGNIPPLTDSHLFVGDATNSAAEVAMSGQGAIDNAGVFTLGDVSILSTQTVNRINDGSTGSLFDTGSGAVNVGTTGSGAVTIGPSPASTTITTTLTSIGADTVINGYVVQKTSVVNTTSASNVVYTNSALQGGFIDRNCSGADRTDTFPTAASVVSGISGVVVGSSYVARIKNSSTGGEVLSILPGTNVNFDFGTLEMLPNEVVTLLMHVDNAVSAEVTYYLTARSTQRVRGLIQRGFNGSQYLTGTPVTPLTIAGPARGGLSYTGSNLVTGFIPGAMYEATYSMNITFSSQSTVSVFIGKSDSVRPTGTIGTAGNLSQLPLNNSGGSSTISCNSLIFEYDASMGDLGLFSSSGSGRTIRIASLSFKEL